MELQAHGLTTRDLRAFLKREAKNRAEALAAGDVGIGEYPGALIATTVPDQKVPIRALRANKFKKVFAFTNPGTGHKVTLWAKKLVD